MEADDIKGNSVPEDGTRIDLGEDLLEASAPPSPNQTPSAANVDDELQKGEILMNERLLEDAKKIFRKILRREPGNVSAKSFLEEIQRLEIQSLLSFEGMRKKLGTADSADQEDPTAVLNRLEKDLRLNLDKLDLKPVPDLFHDDQALSLYRDKTLQTVLALSPRGRIDVGIAHFEMGLFEVAIAIFETVVRYEEYKTVGTYLLGLALIQGGKAIEAIIRIEPFVRDITLTESQKTDLLYLMGIAFEKLSDKPKAREFFRRVYLLNPKYREVADKLK